MLNHLSIPNLDKVYAKGLSNFQSRSKSIAVSTSKMIRDQAKLELQDSKALGYSYFERSLRGAEICYVCNDSIKGKRDLYAIQPTKRLYRNLKNPFNCNFKRSGFNVKIDAIDDNGKFHYASPTLYELQ